MSGSNRVVDAFIEIPRGSRNKYEYDAESGHIRLDRVLHSSVHFPTDYGIIRNTLAPDGDEIDILVIVHEPTFPGCVVDARVIGGLDMSDEKGSDFKVLALPEKDPRFDGIDTLDDLPQHWLLEIQTFFDTYKLLEPKQTEILGWHTARSAWKKIAEAREAYKEAN